MSEIIELRRQIEVECEAMKQAMYGFRTAASHDIINHQYETIGKIQDHLAKIVGNENAARIASETYIQIVE